MTDAVVAKAKKILGSNADFSSAVQNYVELVASELKVQWVGLWQVDKSESYLKLIAYWYSASMTQIESFERDSQPRVHAAGEGMPGKAWRSCALFSSSHLMRDMMLPKSIYASNAGLHSGIWFPVYQNTKVYAVVEALKKDERGFNTSTQKITGCLE